MPLFVPGSPANSAYFPAVRSLMDLRLLALRGSAVAGRAPPVTGPTGRARILKDGCAVLVAGLPQPS